MVELPDVQMPEEEWDEPTHITGDIHWINKYSPPWWVASVIATIVAPPFGAFALSFMVFDGVITNIEEFRKEGER